MSMLSVQQKSGTDYGHGKGEYNSSAESLIVENGTDDGKLKVEVNDNVSEYRANRPAALHRDEPNVLRKRPAGKGDDQLLEITDGLLLPGKLSRKDDLVGSKGIDSASYLLNLKFSSEGITNSHSTGIEPVVELPLVVSEIWVARSTAEPNSANGDDSRQRSDLNDVPVKDDVTSINANMFQKARVQRHHLKHSSTSADDGGRVSPPDPGSPQSNDIPKDLSRNGPALDSVSPDSPNHAGMDSLQSDLSHGTEARNRWRRAKTVLAFTRHASENARTNSSDFLGQSGQEQNASTDAGNAVAAAPEPDRPKGRVKAKGRKGMSGMIVKQGKGMFTLMQDFYVACLKMPIAHFLIGVFLAPIALGSLFTPIYLVDRGGLSLSGVSLLEGVIEVSRVTAAKRTVSAVINVFLYALSLSTTFGGSPVEAQSPFCLVIANVNTLMGQFLFVFLSGAVFARMSQPSHPIRCSKVAIIKQDDFSAAPSEEEKENLKVFAVRMVLTGPAPCELVDAKICLTFRIFLKLPNGSGFCKTQDLELVRSEVAYLRYGLLVRHIIDKKSPLYGHTFESLMDGDASFSLTIMGLERTSMQPIFHMEEYFVYDGDVAWDADYIDMIHVNDNGERVMDHSNIDLIKSIKDQNVEESFQEGKQTSGDKNGGDTPEENDKKSCSRLLKGWSELGLSRKIEGKRTWFFRKTKPNRVPNWGFVA